MAKKHKHEEHVNHERWVISFADMMTLLFALFVVLYALGVQDLEKLKALKKSIQFAFNIAGDGKTQDTGIFDKVSGAGQIAVPAPLVTAQNGPMHEFLKEVLEDYEKKAGKSLEIVLTDDTINVGGPLSDFFPPNKAWPVDPDAVALVERVIDGSLTYTSDIRIVIETPDVAIFRDPNTRRVVTSVELCIERLKTLGRVVRTNPRVLGTMVSHEWREMKDAPRGNWEDQARVYFAFSNARKENR